MTLTFLCSVMNWPIDELSFCIQNVFFSCKKFSCRITVFNYFRFITKVVQNSVEKVTLSDFKASQRAPRKDFCLVLWFNFSHFSKTANSTTLFVLGILWKIWLASPIESLAWQKIAKNFFMIFFAILPAKEIIFHLKRHRPPEICLQNGGLERSGWPRTNVFQIKNII